MSDRLDFLPKVVTSKGAWALGVAFAVAGGITWWLINGQLPDVVHGRGILMHGDSVLDVPATADGVVRKIEDIAQPGRGEIAEEQPLAVIKQPELVLKIELAEKKYDQLLEQDLEMRGKELKNQSLSAAAWKHETDNLKSAEQELVNHRVAVDKEVFVLRKLLAEKLATPSEVLTAEGLLVQTNLNLYNTRNRISQIEAERIRLDRELLEKSAARQKELSETFRNIDELKQTRDRTSQITSPYRGRVLERLVERGNLVLAKDRVLTMEPVGDSLDEFPLQAIVYVLPGEGKRVEARTKMPMRAQISPSTFKVEEHGFIWGKVVRVSDFPSTPEGMKRVLRNDALVQELSGKSSPILVSVSLDRIKGKDERFYWSSPASNHLEVHGGTLCSATIIIGTKHPYEFLIPFLKEKFW